MSCFDMFDKLQEVVEVGRKRRILNEYKALENDWVKTEGGGGTKNMSEDAKTA